MAPLSFRKTDKGSSSGSASGSVSTSSPLPSAPSSSSIPGSTTLFTESSNSSPSTNERSFAARLLRRKPSGSAKSRPVNNGNNYPDSDVPSLIPNTASTTSTFDEVFDHPPPHAGLQPPRRESEPVIGYGKSKSTWGSDGENVVVIDGGTGLGGMSRTTAEHPFINQLSARPTTPLSQQPIAVVEQSSPLYPTPLSPPRRPMPRSRPVDPGLGSRTSSSLSVESALAPAMAPATSAVHPPPLSSGSTVSAEWLSRKPSGRRSIHTNNNTSTGHLTTPKRGIGLGLSGPANIRSGSSQRSRTVSSSSAEASTSGMDSEDGEIGIFDGNRRSMVYPARDGSGGSYEVDVVCTDNREGENEEDEMKWEVVIRRRRPTAESSVSASVLAPSSPLQLSTSSSLAHAPSTASSINLTLSLDQPTGKLVFIAFPMDIHATPRRRPSNVTPSRQPRSQSQPQRQPQSQPQLQSQSQPPPQPSTPPRMRTPPPRTSTPPPAPNPNSSSPTTPPPPTLRHKKRVSQSSMWPSPSRSGSGGAKRSPPLGGPSPRSSEVWTPRRTRMVSASELNGGLYAPGTVDGMSEVLEGTSISNGVTEADRPSLLKGTYGSNGSGGGSGSGSGSNGSGRGSSGNVIPRAPSGLSGTPGSEGRRARWNSDKI